MDNSDHSDHSDYSDYSDYSNYSDKKKDKLIKSNILTFSCNNVTFLDEILQLQSDHDTYPITDDTKNFTLLPQNTKLYYDIKFKLNRTAELFTIEKNQSAITGLREFLNSDIFNSILNKAYAKVQTKNPSIKVHPFNKYLYLSLYFFSFVYLQILVEMETYLLYLIYTKKFLILNCLMEIIQYLKSIMKLWNYFMLIY